MGYFDLRGRDESRMNWLRCMERITRKALSNQTRIDSYSVRLQDKED